MNPEAVSSGAIAVAPAMSPAASSSSATGDVQAPRVSRKRPAAMRLSALATSDDAPSSSTSTTDNHLEEKRHRLVERASGLESSIMATF